MLSQTVYHMQFGVTTIFLKISLFLPSLYQKEEAMTDPALSAACGL